MPILKKYLANSGNVPFPIFIPKISGNSVSKAKTKFAKKQNPKTKKPNKNFLKELFFL